MTLKISVIIATFNSEATILEAINSILNQSYREFEIILVDGNSKDRTLPIIRSMKEPKIKIVSEPDDGIYDAFNKGILRSEGDLITFLGSDDKFADLDYFARSIGYLNDYFINKNIVPCYGLFGGVKFQKSGKTVRVWPNSSEPYKKMKSFVPPHPGAFFSKECFKEIGIFNTTFRISGDYDWLLRFKFFESHALFMDDEISVLMKTGGVSTSLSNFLTKITEDLKICWKYFGFVGWYFYAAKVTIKIGQVFSAK